MKIFIRSNDKEYDTLLSGGVADDVNIIRVGGPGEVNGTATDAFIDFNFDKSKFNEKQFHESIIVLVHAMNPVSKNFIRFNGWLPFIKRNILEISCSDDNIDAAKKVAAVFKKIVKRVPDQTGFIAARIVSMIINEAYFALGEKVSSKEDIDAAMKLGTNYPYGPFEWGSEIGLSNVHALLKDMSTTNQRYLPAPALEKALS